MLKTTIAGIELDCCVYNASGPRTGSIEALEKIASSRAGAVLSKSATLVRQDGNELPRFVNKIDLGSFCQGSMNSEGLPNLGIDYYISTDTTSKIKKYDKPYIVSLSGKDLEENLEMLGRVMLVEDIAAVELNLACPNVPGKPIVAYDFQKMEEWINAICAHPNFHNKALGVKLAPYFDAPHFEEAASIIAKYPIKFVVTINTIGNALMVDTDNEMPQMNAKSGFGGLGGGFVKPTALANVNSVVRLLHSKGRSDIDVIGVGGVASGRDVFDMILVGAKAVQIGTCHWIEGARCFDRISQELEHLMLEKGYSCIDDFRGKLKPFSKELATKTISKSTSPVQPAISKYNTFQTHLPYIIIHTLLAFLCLSVAYCMKNNIEPFF